jgi:hypothetical protein
MFSGALQEMNLTSKMLILVMAGIAGMTVFAVVRFSSPAPAVLGIGLQSYTNASATFTVTNLTRVQLQYFLRLEHQVAGAWTNSSGLALSTQRGAYGVLRPKEVSILTVPVYVYVPPCRWRLCVDCVKPPTTLDAIRQKVGLYLFALKMPRLGGKLWRSSDQQVQVHGPEMEQ